MESRYYCDCSLYIMGCLCIALLFGSCATPQQSAQIPVEDLPQILREVKQTPAIDTTTSNEDDVKLQYSNESTMSRSRLIPKTKHLSWSWKDCKRRSRIL